MQLGIAKDIYGAPIDVGFVFKRHWKDWHGNQIEGKIKTSIKKIEKMCKFFLLNVNI